MGENMAEEKEIINYIIEKLRELKIKSEFEDRQRGKKRYVSKVSAYQDLINLLEEFYEYNK